MTDPGRTHDRSTGVDTNPRTNINRTNDVDVVPGNRSVEAQPDTRSNLFSRHLHHRDFTAQDSLQNSSVISDVTDVYPVEIMLLYEKWHPFLDE